MLGQENTGGGTTAPIFSHSFASAAVATSSATAKVDVRETAVQPQAYVPNHMVGGAPHPGVIVETPGLANVEPPPITYRP